MGAGWTIQKDVLFDTPEYGTDPTAHLAIGVEGRLKFIPWNHRVYGEWNHWSHYRDGGPFNERPETHKDEGVIGITIGGLPR